FVFFFFQAEDGIRDKLVTGVQTCALPILASLGSIAFVALLIRRETGRWATGVVAGAALAACDSFVEGAMDIGRVDAAAVFLVLRSEERRVGKECRSRGVRYE